MKSAASSLKKGEKLLLFSVFVISLCGIVYELVLASLASYLLGNPVLQYSITIGFFMVAMGIGSYLSRFISRNLLRAFIYIEAALGLVGGISVAVLMFLFSFESSYYLLHVFFLLVVGVFVGLEIPLVTRILKEYGSLREVIARVLSLDYLGGLAGSLIFPLVLFPYAGRYLTSLAVGCMNITVAIVIVAKMKYSSRSRLDYLFPVASLLCLVILMMSSSQMSSLINKRLYFDDIVFSKRSKYQEIVLTRSADDFRLYLDGSLQFSTYDEYRYHEMLVWPALCATRAENKVVLIMGGGDGLAAREVLKDNRVKKVVLVELDPDIIHLAKENSTFRRINNNSLRDSRVEVVVGDAFDYIRKCKERFDVIIADFPDPHDEALSRLYSHEFYQLVKKNLKNGGIFVTQSTSPFSARHAFWCIHRTVKEVFGSAIPYHVYVPTFGDWGFVMAPAVSPMRANIKGLRYFSVETFEQSRHFPLDSSEISVRINAFNTPILYRYYLKGWRNVD
ncbi:MAG: polyamine aminopropyltransferase [Spirochaetes bacterium]|nr:polyamine aminopropyltransferase [Spirochaetota bacterium]